MFGLQIKGEADERVKPALPDEAGTAPVIQAEQWLEEIFWKEGRLNFNRTPEFEAWFQYKKDGRLLRERITEKEKKIREAEGQAQAILAVQKAKADGIRMLNEAGASSEVIKLKSLEAFEAAADGKATKIIIPSEIQGIAGLVKSVKEVVAE